MTGAPAPGRMWRDWVTIVIAFQAVAVAVWLVPASVRIVRWPADGPVRLAFLAPAWELGILCAGALVVAAIAARGGRRAAAVLAPFLLLWLWTVPYLPWIPDRFPALLAVAGPLRWIVALVPVAVVVGRLNAPRRLAERVLGISRLTIFVVSLLLYLGFGLYAVRSAGISGDEPHYLVIAESLLKDGDLKIENNHQRGDYRAFSAAALRPDFWERGKDGEIYSVHAPGLAVLVLPAYAVAGHMGAAALMCLISALAALAMFELADRLAGRRAAVLTWMAVCLSVPFIPQAWALFPETPAALLVAWGLLWLTETGERSTTRWMGRGLVLATLPWFHTKFSILLAALGLAIAWRLRTRLATAAAFLAPVAVFTAAWLWSFYAIYGSFDPQAPYGNYTNEYVLTRNIPHGVLGLLLDQKFGLLVHSPIYLLAIAGAWLMLRRGADRFTAIVILVLMALFMASTSRLYMFWGGTSAPARFLVPLLPCLAPLVALALASLSGRMWRAVAATWVIVGIGVAAWAMARPGDRVLFSDPHGRSRAIELVQGSAPIAAMLPTFTEPDWVSQVGVLLPWLLAGLAGLGGAGLWARRADRGLFSVAVAGCLVFLTTGAVAARAPSVQAREETARNGSIDAMWRADAGTLTAIALTALRVASPEQVRELSTVTVRPDPMRVAGGGPVAGPIGLPAGTYRARVWFKDERPRSGEIRATAIPPAPFGQAVGSLPNPTDVAFDLPVTIWRWTLTVDRQNAEAVERVEIVPTAVRPPAEREGVLVRSVEPLDGGEGRYLIYTDGDAFPERGVFWSLGTSSTTVLVAPANASRVVLTLYTGPMNGAVRIEMDGTERSVATVAGQEQDIVLTLPAGQRLVPLTVQSTTRFRPADVDPSSKDMRTLGCQVRVRVE